MNIREEKQKLYKNREGDKTEETHKYREQTEGCWRVCGRGDGLNGEGALRNLPLKSLLHYMLTNLDLNFKKLKIKFKKNLKILCFNGHCQELKDNQQNGRKYDLYLQ